MRMNAVLWRGRRLCVWCFCLCKYRYLRRYKQASVASTAPIVHRQAARRHATLFSSSNGHPTPLAARRLKHPPARYRYPRATKGAPAGPGTCTRLVPVGSQKRCYPPATHANALPEPEPRRLQWRSNPARSTVAGAGLPPQRLRPHGRSPF